MRALVIAPLDVTVGYGADAIGFINALTGRHIDVHLAPTTVAAPLPAAVVNLLTKTPTQVDLVFVLGEPGPLPLFPNTPLVAWTAWPGYSSTPTPTGHGWQPDLLIGYDETILAADTAPKAVLHPGYTPSAWPAARRDWHTERISFCTVGVPHYDVITAFNQLKDEHADFEAAELHIGVREVTQAPPVNPAQRMYVCPDIHTEAVRRGFYPNHHALIASNPGRDLAACEFMSTGGAVIAPTAGTRQWLSGSYGYPLEPFTAVELKEAMLSIHRERVEAARRAELAARIAPAMLGWDAVTERLGLLLAEHLGDVGYRFRYQVRAAHGDHLGQMIPRG